eukprot:133331-Prorocentrum_minimum.AAC.2
MHKHAFLAHLQASDALQAAETITIVAVAITIVMHAVVAGMRGYLSTGEAQPSPLPTMVAASATLTSFRSKRYA